MKTIAKTNIRNALYGLTAGLSLLAAGTLRAQDNLLTPAHEAQLETWLGQGNVTLTKIFSKQPGDNQAEADFHAAVDHQGPTFTVISIYGNGGGTRGPIPLLDAQLIGGYNPQSWDDSLGGYTVTSNLADRTAFLFNLTSGNLVPQNDTAEGKHQVFNLPWYGPAFGSGHDLIVGNNPYKMEQGGGRNHYSYGDGSSEQTLFIGAPNWREFGPNFFFSVAKLEVYSISLNAPPIANAGIDFSVNEGQASVMLDGSGSSDPDNDPLTYAWVQVGGTTVALTGATTASPTFNAPVVALGGETLSFDLTVTANGETSTDTVSVTVVNVNHPPVADAGADQSVANNTAVAEGSPVTLHGEDSFDIDSDTFSFAWVQVGGSPTVTIIGADTANPTFTAPTVSAGGAPGVVATLVFKLTVDDGFAPAPTDAPAPGYDFANVEDTVTVEITNTNNPPVAAAGDDQTVDENSAVTLNGSASSDPDSDPLTYSWTQVGGPAVTLSGATTATPGFIAPFVSAGGADFEFTLTVDDGYDGSNTDNVVIHVQNANDPPLATAAQPTVGTLWPPNHQMVSVGIAGVSDPESNATITITSVTQDEPTNGQGDGDTAVDAVINADGTVLLRSERSGNGDGRVYHIHFTASDFEGSSSGVVTVTVPHSKKKTAVDGGELFNSAE